MLVQCAAPTEYISQYKCKQSVAVLLCQFNKKIKLMVITMLNEKLNIIKSEVIDFSTKINEISNVNFVYIEHQPVYISNIQTKIG